jgi:hypothetical protein
LPTLRHSLPLPPLLLVLQLPLKLRRLRRRRRRLRNPMTIWYVFKGIIFFISSCSRLPVQGFGLFD